MLGRLVRTLGFLFGAGAAAFVVKRTVDERRDERRMGAPVSHWPEVPLDGPSTERRQLNSSPPAG